MLRRLWLTQCLRAYVAQSFLIIKLSSISNIQTQQYPFTGTTPHSIQQSCAGLMYTPTTVATRPAPVRHKSAPKQPKGFPANIFWCPDGSLGSVINIRREIGKTLSGWWFLKPKVRTGLRYVKFRIGMIRDTVDAVFVMTRSSLKAIITLQWRI